MLGGAEGACQASLARAPGDDAALAHTAIDSTPLQQSVAFTEGEPEKTAEFE
jgi:hypothetical protein